MSPSAATLALCLALAGAICAQEERTETWPDGTVRTRFTVDAAGRRNGAFERLDAEGRIVERGGYRNDHKIGTWLALAPDGRITERSNWRDDELDGTSETYHDDGRRALLTTWRKGVLEGDFEEHDATGTWKRAGSYRNGLIHGALKITLGRRTLSRQIWQDGELAKLDGFAPFPRREDELRGHLVDILTPPAVADGAESTAAAAKDHLRADALRRLQAYRYLCRVPHAGMELDARWNDLCDAAAEVCARNGGLDHTPPQPAGMDEARYRQGYEGASHSNLCGGGSMEDSVDRYMDDSDPSNIDRIGHRRWCLNPAMKKTGFGWHDHYSAMWSMDGSGKGTREVDAVLFPPAGWVPTEFFGARHAWSIAPLKGGSIKKDELEISIRALDEHWLATGEPLALDWCDLAGGGYGSGPCLVFRPVGLDCSPGRRWLAEVSIDAGKSIRWRYVVAFVAALDSGGK